MKEMFTKLAKCAICSRIESARTMHHLIIAFAIFPLLGGAGFVTLDLSFSADSSAPSRALLAMPRIGVPEQRYGLMLDFNESRIELNTCHRERSRTFTVAGRPSDFVLFEEEEFMRPELRDFFRLPVVDHCEPGGARNMSAHFYDDCLSDRCNGIIGLSPLSGVWEIWSAFTLTLEALHLGRTNPFFHEPPSLSNLVDDGDDDDDPSDGGADHHVEIACNRRRTESPGGICEFDGVIGGIDVVVDFHTHDSYIYLPHRIYSLYMSGVSLDHVHGAKKFSLSSNSTSRARKREVLFVEPPDEQLLHFHRHLADARDRIAERSIYYQHSLHRYTMTEWLPIVVETREHHGALVLDPDMLIHSPSYSNSYAGAERLASEHFFGEATGLLPTVLLKPHPTEPTSSNRVSIGNGLLRRYTLHVDVLRRRMLIEERVVVEHLTFAELAVAALLFTFFLFSVIYSLEFLAPVSLCIGRPCSCGYVESVDKQYKRVSEHSLREALIFTIELVATPVVLARLPVFIPFSRHSAFFYAWAWSTLAVNGLCLLSNLMYSAFVARGQRPPSGAYCWRSFRIVLSRTATSEQLALLACFGLAVILRRDGLGTPLGAVLGALSIANNVRYVYQVFRFNASVAVARVGGSDPHLTSSKNDLPGRSSNTMWGAFVLYVLFVLNTATTTIFFALHVFWPVTAFSASLSVLIVSLSICAGVWVVHQYADAEMQK